jgi:hypothetical protein
MGEMVTRVSFASRGSVRREYWHEFTFGVGMSFIPYPLVLTPLDKFIKHLMTRLLG